MDDGSVQTQYLGLYERDPNLPAGAPNRFVPVTRDIRNYGLGIYEIWMPPEFRNEYSWGGWMLLPQNHLVNQDAWERRHITSDACGHMADVAQQQANRALRQAHGNASAALGAFDFGFSRIYAGKPMDGISNAIDLYRHGPTGRTIGSYYQGETGFKVRTWILALT
ncbi:MAG TPA: hypothetical protein VJ875_17175 [Pyrinomonadaceae bacterium]|nr:hypothetical protein [Pyrinomonadaceae bacterium]